MCARSMPQHRKKYSTSKEYLSLLVYLYLLVYGTKVLMRDAWTRNRWMPNYTTNDDCVIRSEVCVVSIFIFIFLKFTIFHDRKEKVHTKYAFIINYFCITKNLFSFISLKLKNKHFHLNFLVEQFCKVP